MKKSSAEKALARELQSPLAIIMRRGRAAGRRLVNRSRENSGLGIPWKKMNPRKKLLLALLLSTPLSARADCVWIPTCIPPNDAQADFLVVKLDGAEVRRISPVRPGRGHFWQCGRSTSLLTLSLLRGAEEAEMRFVEDGDPSTPLDPVSCAGGAEFAGPVSLGSYYGPKEQVLRAIRRAQNGGPPIDTNQDGRITQLDQLLLERAALGSMPDYTDFLCAEDVCP